MYTRCSRRVATLPAHLLRRQVRSSLVCKRYLETQPVANEPGLSAGLDSATQELVDSLKVQESIGSSAQPRRIHKEKYGAIFYTGKNLNLRGMFAFLRGVENRFGSIKDFKFHQVSAGIKKSYRKKTFNEPLKLRIETLRRSTFRLVSISPIRPPSKKWRN